jgi:hypothetical protein
MTYILKQNSAEHSGGIELSSKTISIAAMEEKAISLDQGNDSEPMLETVLFCT